MTEYEITTKLWKETKMQYDKITNEKLPNGDISQHMTIMNKELSSLKEKGVNEGLTLQDKAHFIAVAKNLTTAIEYYTKLWSAQILEDENFNEKFLDLGLSVAYAKGASMSEIKADVFDELSLEEIKRVAKVTEKSLKEIGKSELIEKYKVVTGTKSPSVKINRLKD